MGYVLNFLSHLSFICSTRLYEQSFINTETMLWLQRIKCPLLNNDIYFIIILLLKIQGKKTESRKRRTTQVLKLFTPQLKMGAF